MCALRISSGLEWQQALRPDAQSELYKASISSDFEKIVKYVIEQPAALERPFVLTDKGTQVCRPIDTLFEIIDLRPKIPG